MKKRWIVLLLLFCVTGAAGYGFTSEKAQKVQRINSPRVQAVYLECESEGANPLREDAYPEIDRTVAEYFERMQKSASYVEAYHNLHVYTKEGREPDTFAAFVTYNMKIYGIYTEVPGLVTFYVEKAGDEYRLTAKPENAEVQDYIVRLTGHADVQNLFQTVKEAYTQAVQSDALLKEALDDLQSAYAATEETDG